MPPLLPRAASSSSTIFYPSMLLQAWSLYFSGQIAFPFTSCIIALLLRISLPPNAWNSTAAQDDTRHNNIEHVFQRSHPHATYHHRRTHTRCSSKGAISPAAASAAALQLPGASRETASAAAASVQLLPLVFRVFSILNPEDFHTFSAAKCVHRCARQAPNELKRMRQVLLRPLHCAARRPPVRRDAPPVYFCNILRMYADVLCDDGSVVQCSRTLAVVYYCSSVWDASWGGALVDLESSDCSSDAAADAARSAAASTGLQLPLKAKLFPPKFNRLVVFSVPRFHQVTPVAPQPATAAPRLRLSVFGWFLQPGRRYPLMTGDSSRGGGGGRVTKKNAAGDAAAVHAAPRKRKLRGAADPE